METLHDGAKPVMSKEDPTKQLGWIFEHDSFAYDVRENPNDFGSVSYYIEWGDDMDGDMGVHPNMTEARAHLTRLIRASDQARGKTTR